MPIAIVNPTLQKKLVFEAVLSIEVPRASVSGLNEAIRASQRAESIPATVPLALRELVTVASVVIMAGTSNDQAKPTLKKDRNPLPNDRPHKVFPFEMLRSGTQ